MTWTTPGGQISALFNDMLNQPHLLIAGTTGSGKSVLLNGIMATALHRFPFNINRGAQFVLIDPKGTELDDYADLPHTLYYTDSEYAKALQIAGNEMQRRFNLTAEKRKADRTASKIYEGADLYVVIDEWFDLINSNDSREIQRLVQWIAAKGRAARVHIILCTQVALAEILPSKIRDNFCSRVGLRTRDARASRVILGMDGLQNLPLHGKGYYMVPETDREGLYDIPFTQPEEIYRLIDFWMEQYNESRRARASKGA